LGGIADSLKVLKGQDLIKYAQPLSTTNQHPVSIHPMIAYCKADANSRP
jgi:hypothetical protein